jgi:DNA-binding LacI/PurR family transcriptional regulator
MRKSPTIYDVAGRAGVSKSLVSLVLRGSPRVSDEKRDAVLAAVAELDYTPSRLAAGLAGTRTRSIGVVIDEFENLWFAPALAGLRTALGAGGYSLSVADASLNAHLGLDPLEVFRSLRVDGVVLAGEAPEAAAKRLTVPAVVLGTRALELPNAPLIASDELAGGRLATAHLAELGHREIACVTGPGASAAAREAGYLAEMRDRGLAPRVVRAAQTTEAAAREVAAGLFAAEGPGAAVAASDGSRAAASPSPGTDPVPTAVFAVNDPMAVGVIGAARDHGLEVPRGLSVVGYDDSPLAAYEFISLTSVSGDPRELGEAAGRALVALLEGDADPDPGPASLFTPRLSVRGSAAAPRA